MEQAVKHTSSKRVTDSNYASVTFFARIPSFLLYIIPKFVVLLKGRCYSVGLEQTWQAEMGILWCRGQYIPQ